KFAEKIYVLHCFVKKSEKTSKPDIDLGRQRFKEVEKQIKARRKTR
ncbi:type II toxin-antitoxin system RelE/ParE family toxin, partial [Corynebacterium casei]